MVADLVNGWLKSYGLDYKLGQETLNSEIVNATQAHHIFAQSDHPSIVDFIENLIMLTLNQHFSMAHPNNNAQYIDKDFQYICLIAKSTRIHDDLAF